MLFIRYEKNPFLWCIGVQRLGEAFRMTRKIRVQDLSDALVVAKFFLISDGVYETGWLQCMFWCLSYSEKKELCRTLQKGSVDFQKS